MKWKISPLVIIFTLIASMLIFLLIINKPAKNLDSEMTLSIVNPPGTAYQQLVFNISAKNTGNIDLNMYLYNASPVQLKNALTFSKQVASPGQTVTWTSAPIDSKQFEGSITTFKVFIKGNSSLPTITAQSLISPTLVLNITPFIGVNYRTNSLTYNSTSAIAFSNTCGNILKQYGRQSTSYCTSSTASSCPANIGSFNLLYNQSYNIPGRLVRGVENKPACLYLNGSSTGREGEQIGLAWKTTSVSNDFDCPSSNTWNIILFNTVSPYSATVGNSKTSTNPSYEVTCTS